MALKPHRGPAHGNPCCPKRSIVFVGDSFDLKGCSISGLRDRLRCGRCRRAKLGEIHCDLQRQPTCYMFSRRKPG